MFEAYKSYITKKFDNIIKKHTLALYNDLIIETPVGDTGQLRDDWSKPEQIAIMRYKVTNSKEYAPIIWEGDTTVKWDSGYSILNRNILRMNKELKKL